MILHLDHEPDCPFCATGDRELRSVFCYDCCVRYAANMMPSPRRALYREIKKDYDADIYEKFTADVSDYTYACIGAGLML